MHLRHFKDIEYREIKRNVKYVRIEVKWPYEVYVVGDSPESMSNYLCKKYNWVKRKMQYLRGVYKSATIKKNHMPYFGRWYPKEDFKRRKGDFRKPLKIYAEAYAQRLGEDRKIKIKKMITKHASCNSGTIYISQYLSMLPKNLIEYVIFHEHVHKYEKSHNAKFWNIIERKYPDYQKYEGDLAVWWGRVRKVLNGCCVKI